MCMWVDLDVLWRKCSVICTMYFLSFFVAWSRRTRGCIFVCLFFIFSKSENPDFASRLGLEVTPLGVYPRGPRRSSCGLTKGAPPPRNPLRTN